MVGLVVAWHRPRNLTGWFMLALGAGFIVQVDGGLYNLVNYQLGHHLPLAPVVLILWPPRRCSPPVRRRVQAVVDRRFSRVRYDGDRTVEAFAARLQDTVDPDVVRADLAGVVSRALEPAHVTVWTAGHARVRS